MSEPFGPTVLAIMPDEYFLKIHAFGDLLASRAMGMFADRTDLPTTNVEFRVWRAKAWDPPTYRYSS